MELLWIKQPVLNFLGIGWHTKFTGEHDRYPVIEYVCAFCKQESVWQAGAKGFEGIAPVPKCCAQAVPYPVNRPDFAAHLLAKAVWDNERIKRGPVLDMWDEGFGGEYKCDVPAPREVW